MGKFAKIISMAVFPPLFYFVCFAALTFPLLLHLGRGYIADTSDLCCDAAQNLWNMWWVNKAVTDLHQPIWCTNFVHYPHGITLLGHTLNPFNGLAGVLLQKFIPLYQSYNVMVIFGFVVGGWTAFFLAYLFSRSYWGSIIGGYIFTFSSYHFAHALGHLQLVSLEWIPLFVATFYLLLDGRHGLVMAFLSALVLFLVILCDYYYALYCMMIGLILLAHRMLIARDPFLIFRKGYRKPFILFTGMSLVSTGALLGFFMLQDYRDPFTPGAYAPLDLLSPFVYGGMWRFGELTRSVWARIPPNVSESSVHLGLSVLFVLACALVYRNRIGRPHLMLWYVIFAVFTVMALGPSLQVAGREVAHNVLPYRFIMGLLPASRLVGNSVRMMVVSFLAAGVIVAMAFDTLFTRIFKNRFAKPLFIACLVIEYFPARIPVHPVRTPPYAHVIKGLPPGAIADRLNDKYVAPYFQTLYERPRCVGYISRYPERVERKYTEFDEVLMADVPRYSRKLYDEYKLRYILAPPDYPPNPKLKLLYSDEECRIYELQP